MKLAIVSAHNRAAVVPQLMPFISKMAGHTLGRQDAIDISMEMMRADHQLWVLHEEDEDRTLTGYILTRIDIHPQARHLVCVNCGGEINILADVFKEFFGVIEEFARTNGCDGIEWLGRPGWKPFAKECGLRVVQYQYFKDLRGAP